MFSNGKSILVQPIQKDDLITNNIDCRLIDVQQKITDLLSAGYVIYDVTASTNSNFNNLIASSSGNRICVWKGVGSTAYTIYSTELASNGTNVIINATINNMNQVTAIRDCQLTCTASSGLFANKAEFYGGDWYIASWTTGSNVKFTNSDIICHTSEVYMPDVNFDYCNVKFKRSGTIAYSTYKENIDTNFVNETTAGSTTNTLTISFAYTTSSDWFTRCTLKDYQNTGTAILTSTASRSINFTGLKIENSNLAITNTYTTNGSKIYYEGQDIILTASAQYSTWQLLGSTNISSSSGLYPAIAFNQSGVPYVAFQDNSTGGAGKASCYRYGSTGWVVVGNIAFSTNTMDYINICISTLNDIVVVGRDNSSKATAYYYSASASSWNLFGSRGFTTNIINNVKATYEYSLGTYKNIHVVVSNSSSSPYVDMYYCSLNSTTYVWALQGKSYSASSSGLSIPAGITITPNVIGVINSSGNIDVWYNVDGYSSGDIVYLTNGLTTLTGITYIDMHNNNNDAVAAKIACVDNSSKLSVFNWFSTLSVVGYVQFSSGTAKYPSIYNLNNVEYVAIQDTTGKATAYKYVAANSSWNLLGTAAFSTDDAGRMKLTAYNNIPYLAIEEVGTAPGITLYKYDSVSIDSIVNYTFENIETDIFDGEKSLNITDIQSTANYIVQNCKVRPTYNIVDTAVGRFIRNTYNIELAPGWNNPVDETIKETNADTFWIVKREDIEGTLNGKYIKNLKLYNADLSSYTYNSNDNFIIIANNPTKGNAVFCYYNNKIKGTIFSDWYLDSSYEITNCIIIMSVNDISELQNTVPSTALIDGPLENGSITLNSYDNEIII